MKKILLLSAILFGLSSPLNATEYSIDKATSSIEFSGTHAGNAFKGTFGTWDATIKFDDKNLAQSNIKVTIDTSSAKTGDKMYDGTLPTADWFDVKNHPQATFVSDSITKNADGSYNAKGLLTIRGKAVPVAFDFNLSDISTAPVKTNFSLTLDRLAHDIGTKSDAKAEWVSKEIPLNITISANPI